MDPEPAPPKVTGCHLTRSAGYSKIANYSNHFTPLKLQITVIILPRLKLQITVIILLPLKITNYSNHFLLPLKITNYSNHLTPSLITNYSNHFTPIKLRITVIILPP